MSLPETDVTEVAPDVFRICTYLPDLDLGFSQFLVRDDEPLLFHTGMRGIFPLVRGAVATVLDPTTIRWIGLSHFEADECGAINEWLELAPRAEALCTFVSANVNLSDFASRPARVLGAEERLETGTRRFRYLSTPQVPHAWDAGMLFEEGDRTLFCSDLFHQNGDVEAQTEQDLVGRFRSTLRQYEQTPFAGYVPWTPRTRGILDGLAALEPQTLLPMHGSTFRGDGAAAIRDMANMLEEELGRA